MGFPLGVKWHLSSATWAWLPLVTQGSLACLRLRAKYRLFSMVSKNRSFGPFTEIAVACRIGWGAKSVVRDSHQTQLAQLNCLTTTAGWFKDLLAHEMKRVPGANNSASNPMFGVGNLQQPASGVFTLKYVALSHTEY
jgi:hypothetical protein